MLLGASRTCFRWFWSGCSGTRIDTISRWKLLFTLTISYNWSILESMVEIMETITLPWHSLPPFRVCKDRPCSVNGNTLSSPNLSLTQANCQSTSVTCKCFYVVSWLVARFAIVPKKQIIQGSNNLWKVHCCGKKSRETLFLNKMFEWKNIAFFLEKSCLSAVPKKIRSLIKPWLKNSFSTNFQGTGPWEGPIHFSMFFLRVHNF